MRSYGQYCSIAKALDVVGDRWTLLIIRELLIRGGCRYTDLKDRLPRIATHPLADRLRQPQSAGLIPRGGGPPPGAPPLFPPAGPPHRILDLITGKRTAGQAAARGLDISGDAAVLRRVLPVGSAQPAL